MLVVGAVQLSVALPWLAAGGFEPEEPPLLGGGDVDEPPPLGCVLDAGLVAAELDVELLDDEVGVRPVLPVAPD